jgi:hypothetical protein
VSSHVDATRGQQGAKSTSQGSVEGKSRGRPGAKAGATATEAPEDIVRKSSRAEHDVGISTHGAKAAAGGSAKGLHQSSKHINLNLKKVTAEELAAKNLSYFKDAQMKSEQEQAPSGRQRAAAPPPRTSSPGPNRSSFQQKDTSIRHASAERPRAPSPVSLTAARLNSLAAATPQQSRLGATFTAASARPFAPTTNPADKVLVLERVLSYGGGPALLLYDGRLMVRNEGTMHIMLCYVMLCGVILFHVM